jgi:hypothetical protein
MLDQKPEHIQAGCLRQRRQSEKSFVRFHISIRVEIKK